ncbi:hypothetical protein [Yinghuangia seranimata]|uniref:hypothetical protein n=1 Tax=Yinghuangia seranimata TaxID=408067 RepID=UPI00248B6AB0|nr:hypothetical protein [Yinghuangia seranimata]MDI2126725.1 hypothetical protein [Yinghuangia seranimata]
MVASADGAVSVGIGKEPSGPKGGVLDATGAGGEAGTVPPPDEPLNNVPNTAPAPATVTTAATANAATLRRRTRRPRAAICATGTTSARARP